MYQIKFKVFGHSFTGVILDEFAADEFISETLALYGKYASSVRYTLTPYRKSGKSLDRSLARDLIASRTPTGYYSQEF